MSGMADYNARNGRGPRKGPVLAFLALTLALLSLSLSTPAKAKQCPNGAFVKEIEGFDYCSAFRRYLNLEQGNIDRELESVIAADGSLQKKMRSYAFLVSVSHYPSIQNPRLQHLDGVDDEYEFLIRLLKDQGFDEIITLKDGDANKDNIMYFLTEYFPNAFKDRNDKNLLTRFLFAYDGHAMPGDKDQDLPGAIALSGASGDDDPNPQNSVSLGVLRDALMKVASNTYETLALIGSCYSGGVFQARGLGGVQFLLRSRARVSRHYRGEG